MSSLHPSHHQPIISFNPLSTTTTSLTEPIHQSHQELFTVEEQALLQLIQAFLNSQSHHHQSTISSSQQQPQALILPPNHPSDLYHLLYRLLDLIRSLTNQLQSATLAQIELTSNLKISQSNLILAESTVESLQHLISKLQTPSPASHINPSSSQPTPANKRRERIESEQDSTPLYGRLNLFRFGKKPSSLSLGVNLGSNKPSVSLPNSPSPSPSLVSSVIFSSASSQSSSLSSSSSSSLSSSPSLESDQLRGQVALLSAQNEALRANLQAASDAKHQIESELESMSIELFEEANRMVRLERIKYASLQHDYQSLCHRTAHKPSHHLASPLAITTSATCVQSPLELPHNSPIEPEPVCTEDLTAEEKLNGSETRSSVITPVLRTRQPTEQSPEPMTEAEEPARRLSSSSLTGLKPLLLPTSLSFSCPSSASASPAHSPKLMAMRLSTPTPGQSNRHSVAQVLPPRRMTSSPLHYHRPTSCILSRSQSLRTRSPLSFATAAAASPLNPTDASSNELPTPRRSSSGLIPTSNKRSSIAYHHSSRSIQSATSLSSSCSSSSPLKFISSHRLEEDITTTSAASSASSSAIDLDLDMLLASIVDCAESLGIEDELEGIL